MNAVLGLTEFMCDLAEMSWDLKACRVLYAVLGLKDLVCD